MGDKVEVNKKEGGEKEEDAAAAVGPTEVVLKADCKGCADTFKQLLENFPGVDAVSADMANNELTVVGSVDPLKIREHIESKTGKKVDPISPQPTKKDEESAGPKKAQSDSKDQKKADDEKPKPPVSTTVGLKIRLDCDGCRERIRDNILGYKGVRSVIVDPQKDLVTVKGTMNMKEIVLKLEKKFKRNVDLVVGEKKDDGGSEKKHNANANANTGGEKKEKDGDGDKREKGNGGEGGGDDKKKASTEANKMEYYHMPPAAAATATDANSSSAVPEKKKQGISLLDDHNNVLLHPYISDDVYGTTSEVKGSESSVIRRQSSNEMLNILLFSDEEIKYATNNFSDSSKIGQGGYGVVYKGNFHDTEVAIKMLNPSSQQGMTEFLQEMEVLGRMRHPNIVKLIGVCIKLRALVYEFLPHGSVEDCLKINPMLLTWQIRTRIVYDICSTLTFLHSIKPEHVVHGDLKPANILLDATFISKLTDFGLCRFLPGETTTDAFLETRNINGTEWYIDPDFLEKGKLTPGCDVYSFGITIMRILTGLPVARVDRKVERAIRKKSLMAIVDSTAGNWPEDVAKFLARMGLKCCEAKRKNSKLMKDISTGLKDILAKIDT